MCICGYVNVCALVGCASPVFCITVCVLLMSLNVHGVMFEVCADI